MVVVCRCPHACGRVLSRHRHADRSSLLRGQPLGSRWHDRSGSFRSAGRRNHRRNARVKACERHYRNNDAASPRKTKLHSIVEHIDDASLRAAFRFVVMAVVILPLLPTGPYGPLGGIRPRQLWAMVLFFSGLSFAGYLARRAIGSNRGYPIAGMLGGIISSTSVTLSFARASRKETGVGIPLASGVLAACAVMCVRVIFATAVLNLAVSIKLLPYLVGPLVVAAFIAWFGVRNQKEPASDEITPSNPLQFRLALQMAVLFQIVLFAVRWAQNTWGEPGVFISAGVLGLSDIDALVVSMAKDTGAQLPAATAATAIGVGVLSNTLLKLVIGMTMGAKQFRSVVAIGLSAVAVACALSLLWLR